MGLADMTTTVYAKNITCAETKLVRLSAKWNSPVPRSPKPKETTVKIRYEPDRDDYPPPVVRVCRCATCRMFKRHRRASTQRNNKRIRSRLKRHGKPGRMYSTYDDV
jgi:hypothetical protein